jgi:hypothetical protein
MPICWSISNASNAAQCSAILPPSKRNTSIPDVLTRLPVGASPIISPRCTAHTDTGGYVVLFGDRVFILEAKSGNMTLEVATACCHERLRALFIKPGNSP